MIKHICGIITTLVGLLVFFVMAMVLLMGIALSDQSALRARLSDSMRWIDHQAYEIEKTARSALQSRSEERDRGDGR